MNCIIPGSNLKILSKVCQSLSKIGDYLYIEGKNDCLQLSTVNQTKTAFGKFIFQSTFFTSFHLTPTSPTQNNSVSCKIHMKFNIFKSKGTKDKKIEWCKIELDEVTSILIITQMYNHDLYVRHEINLIEKELINVDYDLDRLPNKIVIGKIGMQRLMNNFQNRDEDMGMEFTNDKCIIRNYDSYDEISHDLRSQIFLNSNDFDEYKITKEINVTFAFKPFKAAGNFCEAFNLNGIINFDCGGKPIIFSIHDPAFEGRFILSSVGISKENNTSQAPQAKNRNSQRLGNVSVNNNKIQIDSNKTETGMLSNAIINQLNKSIYTIESPHTEENDTHFEQEKMEVVENESEKNELSKSPRNKLIEMVFARCFKKEFDDVKDLGEKLMSDTDED